MQPIFEAIQDAPISEMNIVDSFTRLIFGDESGFSARELMIIEAFRGVDANVLMDTHREMGEYLRNLGVKEMIHLVARIREQLATHNRGAALGTDDQANASVTNFRRH